MRRPPGLLKQTRFVPHTAAFVGATACRLIQRTPRWAHIVAVPAGTDNGATVTQGLQYMTQHLNRWLGMENNEALFLSAGKAVEANSRIGFRGQPAGPAAGGPLPVFSK